MSNSLRHHGLQHTRLSLSITSKQCWICTRDQGISHLQTASCQGGWQLSRRIPPSSLERNELKQLLETQKRGCSLPELTCHGHGLLFGSPKLLTTQICAPKYSEVKQNETEKRKKKKKVYCRVKQGEWVVCAQNPHTAGWFVGEVLGKIWGEASENVVLFWLVLQDSCAQADIFILYLCRGLGSYQKTQR